MKVRALVFATDSGDLYRAGRTLRSLAAAGIVGERLSEPSPGKVRELFHSGEPLLFLRAGTWLANPVGFTLPHSSATGKGLCAVGALKVLRANDPAIAGAAAVANEWLIKSGGDLGLVARNSGMSVATVAPARAFPALYFDSRAVAMLAGQRALSLNDAVQFAFEEFRVIHFPPLDVCDDRGLRVLQLITALQRGGAERVTLDLMAGLADRDVRVRLATMGRPRRDSFSAPPGTLDLAGVSPDGEARVTFLLREAVAFGADLIHGHLISRNDAARISSGGFPLLLTVHNMRAGWPEGLAGLQHRDATLLAACAQAVERDVIAANLPVPVRTARNGIDIRAFQRTPERVVAAKRLRQTWGFGESDFVMIAVANPRPQKRLHVLPAILAALQARFSDGRQARLVICGEALRANAEAEGCLRQIQAEVVRLHLEGHVRLTGSVADVSEVLAAADALVSTSAHEGLSLAQLEALAMRLPAVATDVGGASEIASDNPRLRLLSAEASADEFARELSLIAAAPVHDKSHPETPSSLRHWSRHGMAARYRWLYRRTIARFHRSGRGEGLWLIANNFSTGGAQSSARRLLAGLAEQGVRVRAAVVEEEPANPTPGRAALLQAGIPVVAVSPGDANPAAAVERLLEVMDADQPQTVVFWNLRPSFKVLLADALLDTAVFDVSPGEMFFDSLEDYFAGQRSSLPYRDARDYGARLAGVVVKYHAEAARAATVLGARVHVIPNGVPLMTPKLPLFGKDEPGTRVAFTTAARINPQKRLEDLLEAFHFAHPRLPPYTLKIAGGVERGCDGYASRLRTLANGLPVEWLGELSDVAEFHGQSDLFVMISEPAGCPNASLEAMAAGLPIIATDVGGASEQVMDRRTGRLVPPRNPQAFADAMVDLATQPALRQDMGCAAQNLVRDRFAVERMIADYRRLFLPDNSRAKD